MPSEPQMSKEEVLRRCRRVARWAMTMCERGHDWDTVRGYERAYHHMLVLEGNSAEDAKPLRARLAKYADENGIL